MNKKNYYHLILPFLALSLASILIFSRFRYQPFHALLSEEIERSSNKVIDSGRAINIDDTNRLLRAIALSPNNCGAYVSLGDAYLLATFPETDKGKNYNPNFKNKKGEYDIKLATEILSKLDFASSNCDQYTIPLKILKGKLYYLMNKPQLTLKELTAINPQEVDVNNLVFVYELMSESYADLNDPINAAQTLIFSLAEEHKSDPNQDLAKVEQINTYLQNTEISLVPNRGSGLGRYSVATIYDNQMRIFGVIDGSPSMLVYLDVGNDGSVLSSKVLDTGESVWGSVVMDSDGNTHVAYLFGDRYVIYANSKDDFVSKAIIDSFTTVPSIANQPNRTRVHSIQIATDRQNLPHLIWSYASGHLGYTVIANGKADTPMIIASDSIFPDIKLFADSTVGIVYNNYESFPNQTTQVWYLEQQNGVWEEAIQISGARVWAGSASLIADNSGSLHVFYVTGTSSEDLALMHAVRNSQGIWQPSEIVGSGNYRPFLPGSSDGNPISFSGRTAPSVAFLSGNRVAVVWRGALIDGFTEVLGRIYSNGQWQPIQVLGKIKGKNYLDTPSIVLTGNTNKINLMWTNDGQLNFYDWEP